MYALSGSWHCLTRLGCTTRDVGTSALFDTLIERAHSLRALSCTVQVSAFDAFRRCVCAPTLTHLRSLSPMLIGSDAVALVECDWSFLHTLVHSLEEICVHGQGDDMHPVVCVNNFVLACAKLTLLKTLVVMIMPTPVVSGRAVGELTNLRMLALTDIDVPPNSTCPHIVTQVRVCVLVRLP